jgi:hypothetical protein
VKRARHREREKQRDRERTPDPGQDPKKTEDEEGNAVLDLVPVDAQEPGHVPILEVRNRSCEALRVLLVQPYVSRLSEGRGGDRKAAHLEAKNCGA